MRTPHGQYPEYQHIGDNLEFLSMNALADSSRSALQRSIIWNTNRIYLNRIQNASRDSESEGCIEPLAEHDEKKE